MVQTREEIMALSDLRTVERNEAGIAAVLGILKQRFGERFQTGQSMREQHAHTTTYIPTQAPDGVAFPESTEEVQEIVRVCAEHRVPVIAFGAGTSLEGHVNAPGGGISLDTSRMNRVLEVNAEDLDCTVEAGVTRAAAQRRICATPACSSRSIPAPTPASAAWRRRGRRAPTRCATARCATTCCR